MVFLRLIQVFFSPTGIKEKNTAEWINGYDYVPSDKQQIMVNDRKIKNMKKLSLLTSDTVSSKNSVYLINPNTLVTIYDS